MNWVLWKLQKGFSAVNGAFFNGGIREHSSAQTHCMLMALNVTASHRSSLCSGNAVIVTGFFPSERMHGLTVRGKHKTTQTYHNKTEKNQPRNAAAGLVYSAHPAASADVEHGFSLHWLRICSIRNSCLIWYIFFIMPWNGRMKCDVTSSSFTCWALGGTGPNEDLGEINCLVTVRSGEAKLSCCLLERSRGEER